MKQTIEHHCVEQTSNSVHQCDLNEIANMATAENMSNSEKLYLYGYLLWIILSDTSERLSDLIFANFQLKSKGDLNHFYRRKIATFTLSTELIEGMSDILIQFGILTVDQNDDSIEQLYIIQSLFFEFLIRNPIYQRRFDITLHLLIELQAFIYGD